MSSDLRRAVQFLANMDGDGAKQRNDVGFNRMDTRFGRELVEKDTWSPRQAHAAWRIIKKYHRQLATIGIDPKVIPEPEVPTVTNSGPQIEVSVEGHAMCLRFPFSRELNEDIKAWFEKPKFDKELKLWKVYDETVELLNMKSFFERHKGHINAQRSVLIWLDKELARRRRATAAQVPTQSTKPTRYGLINIKTGEITRPYQEVLVQYVIDNRRVIVGDEQGLGKTVEGVACFYAVQAHRALIVVPASLKETWARHFQNWRPSKTTPDLNIFVVKRSKDTIPQNAQVVIISYDTFIRMTQEGLGDFDFLAFDESHYLKGHKAQRTQVAKEMSKGVPTVLMFTGTPILNHQGEFLSPLSILNQLDAFGGFWRFQKYFNNYRPNRFGGGYTGWNLDDPKQCAVAEARCQELHIKMTENCYIRREKKDVAPELPPKQRHVVPFEIDNRKEYEAVADKVREWVKNMVILARQQHAIWLNAANDMKTRTDAKREYDRLRLAKNAGQLKQVEMLKLAAVRGKLEAAKEWIENWVAGGKKLIVFAIHDEALQYLRGSFPDAAHILSSDGPDERQRNVDKFQSDHECRLLIGAMGQTPNGSPAGLGWTLTAADTTAFLELGWTPGHHDQCEDRVHRIGQMSDRVEAYYLLGANTIEEHAAQLIDKKRIVVKAATTGQLVVQDEGLSWLMKEALGIDEEEDQ